MTMRLNTGSLMTTRQSEYQAGLSAGHRDVEKCNDESDVAWMQKVTFDNMWGTRPHYVTGYVDGFKSETERT